VIIESQNQQELRLRSIFPQNGVQAGRHGDHMRNKLFSLLTAAAIAVATSVAAFAQMGGMMPGPGTPHTTGGGGITFTGTDAQSLDNPSFGAGTFPSVSIGSASTDRIVFMCWAQHSGSGMAAPTYSIGSGGAGGTAFSLAAGNSVTADNVALYYANITTGTAITVAFPGGANGVSLAVGILTGQSGGGAATPGTGVAPGGNSGGGAQPLTLALTVAAGGFGIACTGQNNVVPGVYTWTGTTSGTGDETSVGPSTVSQVGLAHSTATGTVTASSTTFGFSGTMAGAAMAP
jgi:hypothetical protein